MTDGGELDVWFTIPNALTFARLVAIVPFVYLAVHGMDRAAFILFAIAGLTDTLDGTIARYLGQASRIGRLLDPFVDKLFMGVSFLVLALFRAGFSSIPLWLMVVVLLRDGLILFGSFVIYNARRESGFKPSIFGKLNTLLEMSAIGLFLAKGDFPFVTAILPGLYVALVISLFISTGDYLRFGLRLLRAPAGHR